MKKNDKVTSEFLRDHQDDEVVVWKVYYTPGPQVVYPLYYDRTTLVQPGWIVSNRESQDDDSHDTGTFILRGIHVYMTEQVAKAELSCWEDGRCNIFRCIAKKSDLVAIGGEFNNSIDRAVFMKINLSKEEFEKGRN